MVFCSTCFDKGNNKKPKISSEIPTYLKAALKGIAEQPIFFLLISYSFYRGDSVRSQVVPKIVPSCSKILRK